ncbi:hypothetical protein EJC49_06105 [Aquibium carbonis]|uniref:Uncharacterized protein n=1 Tax=Aquibium carbonis TaxID=2495581 RepID=A0A3S0A8Y4_9HYPH|nr:hypothetical protein [Aquibium carbonis]RST87376.1 hypothetical protein EJC49_06105 [Aquibium carbonis]
MTGVLGYIVLLGAIIFVVSMIMAPFETLGWWAGWLGPHDEPGAAKAAPPPDRDASPVSQAPRAHVVFLAGIGSISGAELMPSEEAFLTRLRDSLPEFALVTDVFPYAPSGLPLFTGQRVFRWLWRTARRWRKAQTFLLPPILHTRNLFQVLVAADNRYGPIYGFGLSRVILDRLIASGYAPADGCPIILMGSSGGGQIAVSAAPYLAAATGASVSVVAFGGVMASDRGVTEAGRLISLYGSRDFVYRLARFAFPGRWPIFAGSHWNRALREKRLVERDIGPISHTGKGGYLDGQARWRDASHLELTVREISIAVRSVMQDVSARQAETIEGVSL